MKIIFYTIFICTFFLTGTLQFIGLSSTMFSYSLIMLVCFALSSVFIIKKKITVNSYMIANLCLLLWIIISGIANHTNPLLIINYLSYVIIPVSIYFLLRDFDFISLKVLINILIMV